MSFAGFLLRQAEGQREHHAESEAGGHPEGLRQTVTPPPANQPANGSAAGTNQPFNQPPSYPVIDLSVCPDKLFLLEEMSEERRCGASPRPGPLNRSYRGCRNLLFQLRVQKR